MVEKMWLISVEEPACYRTRVGCGAASCAEGNGRNTSMGGLSWPKGYFPSISW